MKKKGKNTNKTNKQKNEKNNKKTIKSSFFRCCKCCPFLRRKISYLSLTRRNGSGEIAATSLEESRGCSGRSSRHGTETSYHEVGHVHSNTNILHKGGRKGEEHDANSSANV